MTDSFAKLMAISLVYRLMVILFGSLLVPVVILFALPLIVIGALSPPSSPWPWPATSAICLCPSAC